MNEKAGSTITKASDSLRSTDGKQHGCLAYLDEKVMVPLQGRVEEAAGPFANLLNTQETRVV